MLSLKRHKNIHFNGQIRRVPLRPMNLIIGLLAHCMIKLKSTKIHTVKFLSSDEMK